LRLLGYTQNRLHSVSFTGYSSYHKGVTLAGEQRSHDRVVGYDGNVTRAWHQNAIGVIYMNRKDESLLFHPHRELNFTSKMLLSEYLLGGANKLNYPEGVAVKQAIRIVGEERIQEHDCIMIESSTELKGAFAGHQIEEKHRDILYICPQANYLPLQRISYTLKDGRDVLKSTETVDELMLLEGDVFFPKSISNTLYDESTGAVKHRKAWVLSDVKLSPQYPVDRFRQVEFAPDIIVYLVKDGEIIAAMPTGEYDDVSIEALDGMAREIMDENAIGALRYSEEDQLFNIGA